MDDDMECNDMEFNDMDNDDELLDELKLHFTSYHKEIWAINAQGELCDDILDIIERYNDKDLDAETALSNIYNGVLDTRNSLVDKKRDFSKQLQIVTEKLDYLEDTMENE